MPSSTMLTRKQARQPQARNASSGSSPASENAPAASTSPPGTPMWAKLPKKPRRSAGAYSTASSTAPPYSPPTPMPWSTRSTTSAIGAEHADLVVRRQQADQGRADAHDDQRQQQHLLAADPVAEVAEDQPADRSREEADGEGGEGRELGGRAVEAVEVELVEDDRGGGAVEEEVVPLDGGADGRRERDAARAWVPPGPCVRRCSCGVLLGLGVGLVRRGDSRAPRSTSAPLIRPSRRAGSRSSRWSLAKAERWKTSGCSPSPPPTSWTSSSTITWSPATTSSRTEQS